MTGLLAGVRVVETGVLMAVDNLGRLLGDEGADVVKVEAPGVGDYLRNIMVRFAPDWSTFHLTLNRNKRSVTVDARTDEGREIIASLVTDADVFITGNIGTTNQSTGARLRVDARGQGRHRVLPGHRLRRVAGRTRRCRRTGR